MYTFDVEKIAKYLEKIKATIPKTYKWTANLEGLVRLGVIEIEQLYDLNQKTLYEKEIALKFILEEKLNTYYQEDKARFETLCMWIIQDWGGIKGAKAATTMPRIYDFIHAEKPKYENLPSVSKVGMFMFLKKNIIYDTRVIYALNWILVSQNAGSHFFPLPGGRNVFMNAFDMETLIRIYKAKQYKPEKRSDLQKRNYIKNIDQNVFVKEEDAYAEVIQLIAKVNKYLWEGETSEYPFYTEMLLFASADVEIFHDITSQIALQIR